MLCSQTSLSWEAAFSIGEDQLLIRSSSRGNAQLPSASGIHAIVLYRESNNYAWSDIHGFCLVMFWHDCLPHAV